MKGYSLQGNRDRRTESPNATRCSEPAASIDDLRRWTEAVAGGTITAWSQISGGNRCRSFAVDVASADGATAELYLRYQPPRPPSAEPYTVWREAGIYSAIKGTTVPIPRLIAVNPDFQAILTERAPGGADYRRIAAESDRVTVAREFIAALVALHALPAAVIPDLPPGATTTSCVERELDIWRAMYAETGHTDSLISLAMNWLRENNRAIASPPVLVHGDAGPGNFLFKDGHLTALLDWELSHAGDPMEDLAWFSMRAVMEPVPDFAGLLRYYAQLSGRQVDVARIRYHRVFVSTRVVIIRHRNFTGQPGNSIVSRALNRRLLVEALADANSIALPCGEAVAVGPTPRTSLYDSVIEDLRTEIAAISSEPRVVSAAKGAAKVLKYLRENDRLGNHFVAQDLAALEAILHFRPASVGDGQVALLDAMQAGAITFTDVLGYFAGCVEREAALAASASGGLSTRGFPAIESGPSTNV